MKKALVLLSLFILTACKTDISSDLFTTDLIAVTEGEEVTAPVIIALESSSTECEKTAPDLLKAISSQMSGVEFIGCGKKGYDTVARFRSQAQIIAHTGEAAVPNQAFAIGVQSSGSDSDETYDVSYLVNMDAVRNIWGSLPEEMTRYKTFKFEPSLSVVLNNDLRAATMITVDDVFADGNPVQGTASWELKRRGQVEIQTSNVTNTAFGTTDHSSHIVSFKVQ